MAVIQSIRKAFPKIDTKFQSLTNNCYTFPLILYVKVYNLLAVLNIRDMYPNNKLFDENGNWYSWTKYFFKTFKLILVIVFLNQVVCHLMNEVVCHLINSKIKTRKININGCEFTLNSTIGGGWHHRDIVPPGPKLMNSCVRKWCPPPGGSIIFHL